MNKYEVIIFWSEEDEVFVAEVPQLPGCAAHGSSQEAALASAQEAIRLWSIRRRSLAIRFQSPRVAV
jgi:predicted RNase H-like HicB family nuclease